MNADADSSWNAHHLSDEFVQRSSPPCAHKQRQAKRNKHCTLHAEEEVVTLKMYVWILYSSCSNVNNWWAVEDLRSVMFSFQLPQVHWESSWPVFFISFNPGHTDTFLPRLYQNLGSQWKRDGDTRAQSWLSGCVWTVSGLALFLPVDPDIFHIIRHFPAAEVEAAKMEIWK